MCHCKTTVSKSDVGLSSNGAESLNMSHPESASKIQILNCGPAVWDITEYYSFIVWLKTCTKNTQQKSTSPQPENTDP